MAKNTLQAFFEKVIHWADLIKWITFIVRRNNLAIKFITKAVITTKRFKLLFYKDMTVFVGFFYNLTQSLI